jgi:VanZ family protein
MLPRSATRIPPWKAMVTSWSARAAAIALASTALVASLDEWHQLSIPGRTGTIHDVALDSMAAACVQLLVIAFSDVKRKQLAISN